MATGTIHKSSSGMELLWTNPNPSSDFGQQTVSLDLSNYELIIVIADNYSSPAMATVGGDGNLLTTNYAGNHRIGQRKFTVSTTGVSFENAYYSYANENGSVNNGMVKPQRIYGIKA